MIEEMQPNILSYGRKRLKSDKIYQVNFNNDTM